MSRCRSRVSRRPVDLDGLDPAGVADGDDVGSCSKEAAQPVAHSLADAELDDGRHQRGQAEQFSRVFRDEPFARPVQLIAGQVTAGGHEAGLALGPGVGYLDWRFHGLCR